MSQLSGVVLGCYSGPKKEILLTGAAKKYLGDKESGFIDKLTKCKFEPKVKTSQVHFGLVDPDIYCAVVGLGPADCSYCHKEDLDKKKENIRSSVAAVVRKCADLKIDSVQIDDCGDAKAVAEALTLATYQYSLKSEAPKVFPTFSLLGAPESEDFTEGQNMSKGQNLARRLADTPANLMTPKIFAENVVTEMGQLPKTTVIVRDETWIQDKGMGLLLGVSRGSSEPPRFVEIHYKGRSSDEVDLALVGKGVTFDSGGISLKPPASMSDMKADMQGGACIVGALFAAAKLGLGINVVGIIPLTENMPSGTATKPGDVHYSMKKVSVEVDNTDAEGRLILADALEYAQDLNPKKLIVMATLTGAAVIALGGQASAVYTHDTQMFEDLKAAGGRSGDRLWRMPLYEGYEAFMKSSVADIRNVASVRDGGSCTAASFIAHFVKMSTWAHIDIASTMMNSNSEVCYMEKGMSGRPTRTIIEFIKAEASKLN